MKNSFSEIDVAEKKKNHIPSLVNDGLPQCIDLGHHDKVVLRGETH